VKLSRHQWRVADAAVHHPEFDMRRLGRELGLTEQAVRSALSRAYRVLGIRGRVELPRALEDVR
jgi:lambda repressor-like predicted transcriptional regulator